MRTFIVQRMSEHYGIDWWNAIVPQKIKEDVGKLKDKEAKKYYSNRSDAEIGYTMLGNLAWVIWRCRGISLRIQGYCHR